MLLYQTEDGKTRLEVRLENETVWLSQSQMAELFQITKQNVSLHIQDIFAERELEELSVVKDSLTTAADGKSHRIAKLGDFLRLGDRDILTHAETVSHEPALWKAELEFEKFRVLQLAQASQVKMDFDEAMKKLPKPRKSRKGD